MAVGVYLLLCLFPLIVGVLGPLPPGRGFWVEFGVALGFVAVGTLGVQFILTARFPSFSLAMGQDTLLQFHRVAGTIAGICVLAHPAVLIAADPDYAAFFDPRVNLMRAFSLSAAVLGVLGLIVFSVLRARLAFKYEWWRLSHGVVAALVMVVAAAHVFMVGHYADPLPKKLGLVAVTVAPVLLFLHSRVLRPLGMRRRPWRVAGVRQETEKVWSVTIEPVGHPGVGFRAGQFAWVTFGRGPFSPRQHPFTIASSAAHPESLTFAIKRLGDFTDGVGELPVGTRVFVEGPAGNFVVPPDAPGVVFFAGGIGVTPAMALFRTAADTGDPRPMLLVYATETLAKAPFRDELAALAGDRLAVEHVPEQPPEDWRGESGLLDTEAIGRIVPQEALRTHHFMICGPAPMMDAVESVLLALGVARVRISSERFDII